MKLVLETFFCSCLLATVAPSVDGAKRDLSVWLQSRRKRDLNTLSALRKVETGQFVRPEDVRDTLIPHSSTDISVRAKRSKNSVSQARRPGCSLGTCTVHDLAHRLHQLNNKFNVKSAPIDKISPLGYGRRRRSVPARRVALREEGGRLRPAWSTTDSRLHALEALLRRT